MSSIDSINTRNCQVTTIKRMSISFLVKPLFFLDKIQVYPIAIKALLYFYEELRIARERLIPSQFAIKQKTARFGK